MSNRDPIGKCLRRVDWCHRCRLKISSARVNSSTGLFIILIGIAVPGNVPVRQIVEWDGLDNVIVHCVQKKTPTHIVFHISMNDV